MDSKEIGRLELFPENILIGVEQDVRVLKIIVMGFQVNSESEIRLERMQKGIRVNPDCFHVNKLRRLKISVNKFCTDYCRTIKYQSAYGIMR